MEKDIVPGLLELINEEFDEEILNSNEIKRAIQNLSDKKATYQDANEFAIEVGAILSGLLMLHITVKTLPNGKMYYNVADRVLNETLTKNHNLITGYAADVQDQLNKSSGIGIKAQKPKFNQDKVDGMVERLVADDFEEIKWMLDEPIVNFSQSIVDETVKTNIEFQAKSGLNPGLTRTVDRADACDWCKDLAGVYDSYSDVPDDIYRRHRYCRCTVEAYYSDGRIQNSHTKKWRDPERELKIEVRKNTGIGKG